MDTRRVSWGPESTFLSKFYLEKKNRLNFYWEGKDWGKCLQYMCKKLKSLLCKTSYKMRIPPIKTVNHAQKTYIQNNTFNVLTVQPHLNQGIKTKIQRYEVELICISGFVAHYHHQPTGLILVAVHDCLLGPQILFLSLSSLLPKPPSPLVNNLMCWTWSLSPFRAQNRIEHNPWFMTRFSLVHVRLSF